MRKSIGTSTVIKNLQMRGLKFGRAIGRCTDNNMRLSTIVLNFYDEDMYVSWVKGNQVVCLFY